MNILRHENPPGSTCESTSDELSFSQGRKRLKPKLPPEARQSASRSIEWQRHTGEFFYRNVQRDYAVYPVNIDPAKPCGLIIFQDGKMYSDDKFRAHHMLDSLVGAGDIPPVVALFVQPGDMPGSPPETQGNRSLEYDSLSDTYVSFLLEELMPKALAGINVSEDPGQRLICGMSSGGICAFNAAWERPSSFGKVISHCGSFTNIRGGHTYPSRVRSTQRKPIRVFLQSGADDLDRERGNWPAANFDMATALAQKGYDYRFEFGRGGHDLKHGASVFPSTLRWLWR